MLTAIGVIFAYLKPIVGIPAAVVLFMVGAWLIWRAYSKRTVADNEADVISPQASKTNNNPSTKPTVIIGGFAGHIKGNPQIINCSSKGKISVKTNTPSDFVIGGFAGQQGRVGS